MIIKEQTEGKLRLSNDGHLSIYFIGSGAAFSKTMNQNNILITKGDEHLFIDCGGKFPQALYELGMATSEPENFLITHTHADHIGGLEEIMMMHRYVTGKRPSIIINEEFEDILWNQSLSGGAAYSEVKDGKPLGFADFWTARRPQLVADMPRETWEYQQGSLNIKMPRTMHFPDSAKTWQDSFWSCGVIIDDRAFFTSDTRFDRDLVESFDERFNFEVIFHDCQFFNGGVHASIDELSTLSPALKAKTVLMHYGDNWKNFEQRVEQEGFMGFAQQGEFYIFE